MRLKEAGKGRVPCIIVNLAAARWMSGSVLLIKPEVRIAEYCLQSKEICFRGIKAGNFERLVLLARAINQNKALALS